MITGGFPAQKEQGIFLGEQGFVKPELRIFKTLAGANEKVAAMAHTCPDGYMPLAEAFEEALSALENRDSLLQLISDAKTEDECDQLFIDLDALGRRVERLMRDALADGLLPTFVRTPNNTVERLVEREEWRKEAFGMPNLESVADAVLNPGVDTGGRPVLLKVDDFLKWLSSVRHDVNPFRSGAPGKPSAIQLVEAEHKRRLDCGEALTKVSKEAAHLEVWLNGKYPDAPRTTAKTIENRIREAHRRHANGIAAHPPIHPPILSTAGDL
jgi:hypothetical protein